MGEDLTHHTTTSGVYIAVGHGAWGISHSLGTGLVVSEMIEGKKTSADVSVLAMK
jgi:glycine/D-amino acid oxidase-like deaminating enzyme